jgi:protein-tyrosine phosphatase
MIDIHNHILPNIDDGADTIETSLEMLRIGQADGIKKIIATPHYGNGYFETPFQDVLKLVEDINMKAKENNIDIEILPGQEVFLNTHLLSSYKQGLISTLNNSKYMLIELPFDHMPKETFDIIYELRLLGITPIIAHPERYIYIIKKASTINQFIDEGCLFQLTSGSITGLFGKEVQRTAENLLRHRICHFIASDAHTINKRCPQIKKSFDKLRETAGEYVKILTNNVEKIMVNSYINHDLEKIRESKGFLEYFKFKR